MPKDLQPNKPCRADTKKSNVVNAKHSKTSATSFIAKVSKVLADKIVKPKKPDTKKKPPKIVAVAGDGGGEKVKGRKKPEPVAVPIKTRSGVCLGDSNAASRTTAGAKMKDKQKTTPVGDKAKGGKDDKGKNTKKETPAKKSPASASYIVGANATQVGVKKDPKKTKNDKDDDTTKKPTKPAKKDDLGDKKETAKSEKIAEDNETSVTSAKKDPKKDKETTAQTTKKTTSKGKKDDNDKKDAAKNVDKSEDKKDLVKKEDESAKKDASKKDAAKTINDKEPKPKPSDGSKKRPKKTKETETVKKEPDERCQSSNETSDKRDSSGPSKKIKFFKSKSKKLEKPKEPSSKKNSDLKADAFSVYDNIDDDSEECGKTSKKPDTATGKTKASKTSKETETKIKQQHSEESKKGKSKRKPDKSDDKRKLDSDSEVENPKSRKKLKKNVEDDDDETYEPTTPTQSKQVAKKSTPKAPPKDDDNSSLSSDNTPLNKLVTKNTKSKALAVKREPHSDDDSDADAKKKCKPKPKSGKCEDRKTTPKKSPKCIKDAKSSASPAKGKATPKKVVRFEKQATTKTSPAPAPVKAVRRRKQRMASLNAMAMVHCLYENEYKSVSVSSHDSTEENSDDNTSENASEPPASKRKCESSPVAEAKPANNKETALVKYEKDALRVADPDPVICRESLRSAPGLRSVGKHWDMNSSSISSTLSDENVDIIAPPIVIKELAAIDKPMVAKNALKKKFARALRRQVSEESSEEEKHQALLLEEKKRMVRRRRRQRKEITMDLKDMVVCKRMASLNATAILAASYSSTTGKRTITVKSSGKGEEKRENVENFEKTESVIAKIKNRKLPFVRKKFSSSSDADVEDEADLSGSEVVVKTASSSGKQQVSLIVNQDSGVTITGVYLNSTTKSTHHQGYCSISGMQYRISSTSHTQTEATAVASEAMVRTPQEPLRPPITVSLHPDRQSPPPAHNVALAAGHPSPVKTYTPLGALSNMQPPGSPHHVHHLHHHPKTVTISSTQEISSLERHGCPSAFSAPTVYGPPPPPLPAVASRPPYPILSKTPPEPGFVTGYYQPAGPLISHHHHHHHHHHHVQANTTTTASTAAALPASSATSAPSSGPAMSYSTKVSRSPLVQPPTPPASNVTQPVSENSDNEMTSATTPAVEITQPTDTAPEEPNFPPAYRFGPPPSANPPFRSPSHNYQTYYPSPPSTASLSHPQQQQAHFQEILYSGSPAAGPPAPYHLSYLQPKAAPYHGPFQRRYIPALPPQQYFHHEYSSTVPATNAVQQQVVVPAHPLTSTADSYHSAPPTPSVVESYPPPPPPLYYSGYNSAPPTPYYPYATSSRSLTLVETSCPCPLQGCQKNVHTGPLTGIISKGPVKQHSTPLSPVALSLPKEPQDIRSLPSPARGSAGCRPTPSPAIATAKNPSCWSEGTDCSSYDTTGLLAISKTNERRSPGPKNGCKSSRSKLKLKKIKSRKSLKQQQNHHVCKLDENMKTVDTAGFRLNGAAGRQSFYTDVHENSDTVGLMAAGAITDYVSRVKPTIVEVCETDVYDENTIDTSDDPKTKKYHQNRKRRCLDDDTDRDMLKSYPVMRENVQKTNIHLSPDDQQLVKKPKLDIDQPQVQPIEDDKPVDVEKNTYLSALQLCSVSNVETHPEEELAKETSAVPENLAPLRKREDDDSLKIPVKTQENVVERRSHHVPDTTVEQSQPDNVEQASATSALPCKTNVESKKPPRLKRRRWTTKKRNKKKNNKATKGSEEEKIEAENAEKIRRAELLSLTEKRAASKLKWSNGWSWLGEPFVSKVFLNTEGSEVLRTCYHAMKHHAGDIIKPKDCILLRSGSKKSDLPYVAKVAHLWEDPEDGEMMMSLFWFYRPEHTEHDSIHSESPYELYASKHKDINSVACIEDKCYVLTFNEYCRYHKSIRQSEESVDVSSVIVPPLSKKRYPRHSLLPPENTSLDLVFFCRKIYDFRQHRLLKNPFFV